MTSTDKKRRLAEDCGRCNYDMHVCPGCGVGLAHGIEACDECLRETAHE